MSDLRERRPTSATPTILEPSEPHQPASSPWIERATSRLKSLADALARKVTGEPVIDQFAEMAALAHEPEEVRLELVRLASKISGATRVELFSDRDGRAARRLACWPLTVPIETTSEIPSPPRGPIGGASFRAIKGRTGPLTLQLPLRAGDSCLGSLRLTAKGGRPWPAPMVRRLTTLCAIASAAERGLGRPARTQNDACFDPGQGSTILAAFLTFAQAQARRRHEPLSLLEVGVDRLESIRELLGDELAEAAIERVSRAIHATVRVSDIVARLEDGRIAVLLPNASDENASRVAEAVRAAIARAGAASTTMPTLTASIGVATYPDHAHDVVTLRAAASSTLTRAKCLGHDQIVSATPIPAIASPKLAHRVG